MSLVHTPTGSEATGGMVFGLSDEIPMLQNLMCSGNEYSLSDCPGYDLNGVTGTYCLSGDYQAGVRCLEGRELHRHCSQLRTYILITVYVPTHFHQLVIS